MNLSLIFEFKGDGDLAFWGCPQSTQALRRPGQTWNLVQKQANTYAGDWLWWMSCT